MQRRLRTQPQHRTQLLAAARLTAAVAADIKAAAVSIKL
jgi:hypothetical protein